MRLQALAGSSPESEATAVETIISILDSLSSGSDVATYARDMWETLPDPNDLVQVCLRWSSSIYRRGQARIYLAARLLRKWHRMGLDVETPILNLLAAESNTCLLERSSLYKVIAELVRSRHFSVGNYLQWVIANGILSRYDDTVTVRYTKTCCKVILTL